MNWDAVAAIIGALTLFLAVAGGLVFYGKLIQIVNNHDERLKEHKVTLEKHGEELQDHGERLAAGHL